MTADQFGPAFKMTPGHFFSTRRVLGPDDPSGPVIQLTQDGRDVGPPLQGAVLEHQFQLPDGRFLLFLSEDCPYEETLRIELLSADFERLDGLELGADFVTGTLENVEPIDDATVEFSFVHRHRCRLNVRREPKLPTFPPWFPGVRRTGRRFNCYLQLERISRSR